MVEPTVTATTPVEMVPDDPLRKVEIPDHQLTQIPITPRTRNVLIGLGVLLVVVEFLHGPAGATGATPTIFGLPSYSLPWAERAFLFLFGAIHVLVAAIITVYRRTAV